MSNPAKQQTDQTAKRLWQPKAAPDSQLARFMREAGDFKNFEALHRWSISAPEKFWGALWDFAGVIGDKSKTVIEKTATVPWARFFPDSKISYAENMLAQAEKTPDAPAIIYRLQNNPDSILSWKQLYDQVSLWQQALERAGVKEGDRVAVYLSNVPETVILLLAASNIGATFASAGMEMGPSDLINRFSQVKPKILITDTGYTHGEKTISRLDVIDRVRQEIGSIEKTVFISPHPSSLRSDTLSHGEREASASEQGEGVSLKDFFKGLTPQKIKFTRRDFNHPLYILFSSGSTGKPKCFEHSTGGVFLKHVCEYVLHCDVRPGDRVFYHATPSWMMWNWLVSGLAMKAAILMYDGSPAYPDANAQWAFTSAHQCTHHGTAAPVILSWIAVGIAPKDKFDLAPLRAVLSTGAVLPAQGFTYIHEKVKQDVKIGSISGGTDIVGCFLGGNPLTPTYAGQLNGPMLGMDVRVWDDDGHERKAGQAGELVCTNPFPSMPLRFLDDENGARYTGEYFEHYGAEKHVWRHGDSIQKTPEGQFIIIGRSDATLNQNGVRIGTGAIYDQLAPLRDKIREAAAIDFCRPDNSQTITVLFLALNDNAAQIPEDLVKSIKAAVKNNVGPYSVPTEIIAVPGVLKTPNGKIAEVVMKKILSGKSIPNASLYGEDLVRNFEKIGRELAEKYN